jgi:HSP20 family protein
MYTLTRNVRPFADIDRVFEDFFGRTPAEQVSEFAPAIEIAEDAEGYCVRAELAGVAPADVEVSVENDTLTIRGEKKADGVTKDGRVHRSERRYGKFARAVEFPNAIDADHVTASHRNGVLTINLPKHARAKARTVKVDVAE